MKRLLIIAALLSISACSPIDPKEYDMRSPCVSEFVSGNEYINLEVPCQRRIPLENKRGVRIIAVS